MKSVKRNLKSELPLLIFSILIIMTVAVRGQNNGENPKPSASPVQAKKPTELQKALEEFRIQMGLLGAGAGKTKAAGKQNSLSGRIFEYLRNDLMDAVPHEVRQRGGDKSLLRRNQFGFSLNGPVLLPKLYDGRGRTFFSISYEGTRERIAQSSLFTVPTAGQQAGDFSDLVDSAGEPVLVYDPATTRPNPAYDPSKPVSSENLQFLRDPFPGNVIPENRLDSVARALLAMYPAPNASVGPFQQNNYWINSPFENRADGVISKVDHSLTDKHQLAVNLNASRGVRKSPEFFPGPANSGNPSYTYENGGIALQDSYVASPMVNWSFRVSGAYSATKSLETDQLMNYPDALGLKGVFSDYFPRFSIGSYLPAGPRTAVFSERSYFYDGSAAVSINRRANTIRMAAIARRSYSNSFSPAFPAGLFHFGSSITSLPGLANTGNAFASFLLGEVSRAEESLVIHPSYFSKNSFDVNLSDEYRVRPGLTLNFGMSFEISTPRVEKYNRQSTVSFDRINPENGKPGALVFAGIDGIGRSLQPITARIEPNFGLAVNPWSDRSTILRVNYSLSYDEYPLFGRTFGTQGFNAAPVFTSPNDQLQSAFRLREGMPVDFSMPPFLDPAAANGTDADYIDPAGLLPSNQQWSLSIQRELPHSLSVEARYNGWRGENLFIDGLIRLNAVPIEFLSYRDQLYDDAFRNSLRPYPQYRNLDLGGVYPAGDVEGHAVTVTVDQRLTGGLFGRASYRLAKVMDNYSTGAAQNPADLESEWALSASDITHTLQLSYTYELPFGKGKKMFNDGDLWTRVLGGWSLSGLTTMRGGAPLILRPLFNRTGGLVGNLRVNVVPGEDPKVEDPSPDRWFNPDAFAQPDDFTLGDGPRTHPYLRNPGEQFHHISVTKRMELTADTTLELVTESFNFPNHANLNDPDTRIGSEANPNLNAGKIIGSSGGRVMQVGLRILF